MSTALIVGAYFLLVALAWLAAAVIRLRRRVAEIENSRVLVTIGAGQLVSVTVRELELIECFRGGWEPESPADLLGLDVRLQPARDVFR